MVCVQKFARILPCALLFLSMVNSIGSCLDYKVLKHFLASEFWFSVITENIYFIWLIAGIEVSQFPYTYTQSFSLVCIFAMITLTYGHLYKCLYDF